MDESLIARLWRLVRESRIAGIIFILIFLLLIIALAQLCEAESIPSESEVLGPVSEVPDAKDVKNCYQGTLLRYCQSRRLSEDNNEVVVESPGVFYVSVEVAGQDELTILRNFCASERELIKFECDGSAVVRISVPIRDGYVCFMGQEISISFRSLIQEVWPKEEGVECTL